MLLIIHRVASYVDFHYANGNFVKTYNINVLVEPVFNIHESEHCTIKLASLISFHYLDYDVSTQKNQGNIA
jgi:hypothetical protein